ncbi:MAG TPA: cyclodeaminase [Alphaproteobacteria bacterium]|nr:cyclodeaminase [Alphaproteobacteria bacterium]
MPKIKILVEAELRAHLHLDAEVVRCIEQAFAALATGAVAMPPILRLDIPAHRGEVDVKTAYVPGIDSFAIKISPGFFDNPKLGLPSLNGLMVVLSARTGVAEGLLLDNGYLTEIRTAAAGAVVAKHLARADARRAAILGSGAQARLQLEALTLVRPIEWAALWARRKDQAERVARELTERLGINVGAVEDPEAAVAEADVIVTATPATEPILKSAWLKPGQHVTAMGSDAEHKNELEPAVLSRADLYVCDRASQCARLGELHHAIAAGVVAADATWPELGEIVAGRHPGRRSDEQITICDLTGTGVQDTAIAALARARCVAAGVGLEIEA